MASVGTLKADIKSLSDFALQDLFDFIGEIMTLNSLTRNLPKDCKFLANYLHWFKWEQCFKDDKDIIKSKNIIVQSTTNFVDTRIVTYKGRKPIFR